MVLLLLTASTHCYYYYYWLLLLTTTTAHYYYSLLLLLLTTITRYYYSLSLLSSISSLFSPSSLSLLSRKNCRIMRWASSQNHFKIISKLSQNHLKINPKIDPKCSPNGSLERPGAQPKYNHNSRSIFLLILAPFWVPEGPQKSLKTCFFRYSKANQNSSRFSIAFSTDLGSIFDGFGDVFLMIAEVWLFIW